MKKKGVGLIEVVLAVAIVGLLFLLASPLMSSYNQIDERTRKQNQIDSEFSDVSQFIKRNVRSAKQVNSSYGAYAGVYKTFSSNSGDFFQDSNKVDASKQERGSVLFLQIPNYETESTEFVFFIFEDNKLKYRRNFDGTNEVLMESVEYAGFRYEEGVVLYFIDLDVEGYEEKIRDSIGEAVVTKIDIKLPE